MHVNVNAPFILTKILLPLLGKSTDASIVFTTSGVSIKGRAYWGAYAVSKFANEGLMQVLADELATDSPIRSNSVNPGAVRSPMRAKAYPGEDAEKLTPARGRARAVSVPAGPRQPGRYRLPLRRAVDFLRRSGAGRGRGRGLRPVSLRSRPASV